MHDYIRDGAFIVRTVLALRSEKTSIAELAEHHPIFAEAACPCRFESQERNELANVSTCSRLISVGFTP